MARYRKLGSSLLLFPAVFALAVLAGCNAGAAATGNFDRSYNVSSPIRLELSNASGDVNITGSSDGKVRVHGEVEPDELATLENGVTIDGVSYGPIRASLERQQRSNAWIAMALREGKNREVRRVLEHLGLRVTRLIRLSYGPFQLGNLERGGVTEVPKKVLAEQLGATDAAAHAGRRR